MASRHSRLPIFNPKSKPISKKKKKSESHAPQPDAVIIASLEGLRSQSEFSSSSSKTLTQADLEADLEFDAASISELMQLRDKDRSDSDDDDYFMVPCTGGAVVGTLIISDDVKGYFLDCTRLSGGKIIPPNPYSIGNLKSDALFVLLVDDGDVFMRLTEDQFCKRFPCIIILAQGQHHGGTRNFLRRLKMEFNLPVFALLDSDPYSLQILSFYTYDSLDIKWLGLRPSDLDKYQIPMHCRHPMTDEDVKLGKDLLNKDIVRGNERWVKELEMMVNTRQKAEILALSFFDFQYLTQVYLPLKLQQQDWL